MNVSVLDRPPISNSIPEVRFKADGETSWILFDPEESERWVGVFGRGRALGPRSVAVASLMEKGISYVIVAGRDYIIDHHARTLRCWFDDSRADGVIAVDTLSIFVLWDDITLQAVDTDGRCHWSSRRVAWDGIRSVRLIDDTIIGEGWSVVDSKWIAFVVSAVTGEASGGGYLQGPWDST